jgi:hypothetical protein
MITRTLTGNTRFREQKRWFKPSLLVLQVEEHLKGYMLDPHGTTDIDECRFRDLSVCDLQAPLTLSNWPLLQK